MKHLLYLPKDYHKTQKEYPLLLFLHGAGESGNNIENLKRHGPPKLIAEGKEFNFIVVSPQSPNNNGVWDELAVKMLLIQITAEYRVDEKRIYLTGISRGGYGTWRMAILNPTKFAAIIPICGGGDPSQVHKIKHLPVWAFHGAKDDIIPVTESERMVKALSEAGGNVKLTIYPDADHDSWTATYNNPEIYEWLLAQSKT